MINFKFLDDDIFTIVDAYFHENNVDLDYFLDSGMNPNLLSENNKNIMLELFDMSNVQKEKEQLLFVYSSLLSYGANPFLGEYNPIFLNFVTSNFDGITSEKQDIRRRLIIDGRLDEIGPYLSSKSKEVLKNFVK